MQKILLTGGLGFQGTHLTKRLLSEGYSVYVLNTPSEPAQANLQWLLETTPSAKANGNLFVIWGSITDKECIERLVPQVNAIIHLAAKINVDESIARPEVFYETNVLGTMHLLNWAVKHNVRFILSSTCEVYGGGEILDEHSILNPRSPYAASKAAADRMAYAYSQTFKLPVDIVRPFNVFGPLQKEGSFGAVIPKFFKSVMHGEEVTIFGDGKQSRDFVYVEDVVNAYVHILKAKKTNLCDIYTFGSGAATTVIDILNAIETITGKKAKRVHGEARKGEVPIFMAKHTITHYFPDAKPFPLQEGLRRYYQHRYADN